MSARLEQRSKSYCRTVLRALAPAECPWTCCRQARVFSDECKSVSAVVRQLTAFLDDLEDNTLEGAVLAQAQDALKVRVLAHDTQSTALTALRALEGTDALQSSAPQPSRIPALTDSAEAHPQRRSKTACSGAFWSVELCPPPMVAGAPGRPAPHPHVCVSHL